jgi:hypothetical protein
LPTPPLDPKLIEEAYEAVLKYGNISEASRVTGIPRKTLSERYNRYAAEWGGHEIRDWTYPERLELQLRGKTLLVGGDAHFWPGQRSVIWEAFVEVAHAIKPDAIILNGDMIDGTRVSRHPRLRNQNAPRVVDELNEAERQIDRLPEAEHRLWMLGNHDTRLDNYLANSAPEVDDAAKSLRDWFPNWEFAYATVVNEGLPRVIPTEVRHFYRMGNHARWNNVMYSGIHMVTNHTHGSGVTPFNNRLGRIYGIETGMLNSNHAPQFEYHQGMPSRSNGGFAVLSFDDAGNLLPPELCEHVYGRAWFRGRVWGEKPRVRVQAARAA